MGVGRRIYQFQGIRRPYEGRPKRHLLHYWRECRSSLLFAVLGESSQERFGSHLHGGPHRRVLRAATQGVRRQEIEVSHEGGLGYRRRGREEENGRAEGRVRASYKTHERGTR